jgi:hypothetical protein
VKRNPVESLRQTVEKTYFSAALKPVIDVYFAPGPDFQLQSYRLNFSVIIDKPA